LASCAAESGDAGNLDADEAAEFGEMTAGLLTPIGTSTFKNRKSGLCIGVDGASTANGAFIKQFTCGNAAPNQTWILDELDFGVYSLVNQKSGRCMGVDLASVDPGADIRQFTCEGAANQKWSFVEATGSDVWIVNFKSGLCIGVDGGSIENGAQLKQFPCSTPPAPNQSWDPEF
jgi:hypothetical protein